MSDPRRPDEVRSRRERLLTAVALAACVTSAFFLRVDFRHESVFADAGVRFQGNDSWYHARLIDNLVANFPRPLRFDPFARFPGGETVLTPPFFDWVAAGVAVVAGGGAPSQRLTETVAAYLPPVLGSLTIVPVFFLGRRLFGRAAGLLGAAALAVLPGQFLVRTALGVTDHHVAETALTTVAMFLLVEGLVRGRGWVWGVLSGAGLALYFLTWSGASLFATIVAGWAVLQIIVDHLAARSPPTRAVLALPALALPLATVLLCRETLYRSDVSLIALSGGLVVVSALYAASRALSACRANRWWIVPVAAVPPLAALALVQAAAPSWIDRVKTELERMAGTSTTATVAEGLALLFPAGRFEPALTWLQFASGSFLAPLAFGYLVYLTWRDPRAERLLFLLWTVVVIAATLGQNRFAYYAAVNVSLLTGAAAATVLEWGGLAAWRPSAGGARAGYRVLAAVAVLLLVFVPCLRVSLPTMTRDQGPSASWMEALDWLRENTPEPFPDPGEYLRHHDLPGPAGFSYPPSAYGILNWWDQGYWIVRRARRIPSSNPTQAGAAESARFLVEQDEDRALGRLQALGSRYVVVDRLLVYLPSGRGSLVGRFRAMTVYAGRAESEFVARYWYRRADGKLAPLELLRPEYYRTMVARLYLFRGRAYEPRDSTWLVASRAVRGPGGREVRLVTDLRRVASWPEAAAFLAEHAGAGYEAMGRDPMASCVPLDELAHFRQVHPTAEGDQGPAVAREVRIFEVVTGPPTAPLFP